MSKYYEYWTDDPETTGSWISRLFPQVASVIVHRATEQGLHLLLRHLVAVEGSKQDDFGQLAKSCMKIVTPAILPTDPLHGFHELVQAADRFGFKVFPCSVSLDEGDPVSTMAGFTLCFSSHGAILTVKESSQVASDIFIGWQEDSRFVTIGWEDDRFVPICQALGIEREALLGSLLWDPSDAHKQKTYEQVRLSLHPKVAETCQTSITFVAVSPPLPQMAAK